MPVGPGPQAYTVKVNDIIRGAVRLLGGVAQGASLPAHEMRDGLASLNRMVDSAGAEKGMIKSLAHEDYALVASQQDYTFGAGGNWDADRPPKIERATLTVDNIPYTAPYFQEMTDAEWAARDTTITGIPRGYHIDTTSPLMTVGFYPIPDGAYTFTPFVWSQIGVLALGDDVSLPPAYEEWLMYGLAIRLAPEYGAKDLSTIVPIYTAVKTTIKRMNQPDVKMACDTALQPRGYYDIRTGQIV